MEDRFLECLCNDRGKPGLVRTCRVASMKEWLITVSEPAIVIINGLALAMIIVGTAEAFVKE